MRPLPGLLATTGSASRKHWRCSSAPPPDGLLIRQTKFQKGPAPTAAARVPCCVCAACVRRPGLFISGSGEPLQVSTCWVLTPLPAGRENDRASCSPLLDIQALSSLENQRCRSGLRDHVQPARHHDDLNYSQAIDRSRSLQRNREPPSRKRKVGLKRHSDVFC